MNTLIQYFVLHCSNDFFYLIKYNHNVVRVTQNIIGSIEPVDCKIERKKSITKKISCGVGLHTSVISHTVGTDGDWIRVLVAYGGAGELCVL